MHTIRIFTISTLLLLSHTLFCSESVQIEGKEELKRLMQERFSCYQEVANILCENTRNDYWNMILAIMTLDLEPCVIATNNENNIEVYEKTVRKQLISRVRLGRVFRLFIDDCCPNVSEHNHVVDIGRKINSIRRSTDILLNNNSELLPVLLAIIENFITEINTEKIVG